MSRHIRFRTAVLSLALVLIASFGGLAAQQPPERGDAELRQAVERYFERRLRAELALSDDQLEAVLPPLKAMQRSQSEIERERRQTFVRLRAGYQRGADDATLSGLLQRLEELEARKLSQRTEAMTEVDGALSVRQQVRLRLFLHQFGNDFRERVQQLRRKRPGGPGR